MSDIILKEFSYFFVCISTGIVLMFGYDILRTLRNVLLHNRIWRSIEDFFYWSSAGIISFTVMFLKNNGALRGFACAAILLGMFFYYQYVSKGMVTLMTTVFQWIWNVILRFIHFLFLPLSFLSKKMNKIEKNIRNMLKKRKKKVRMFLSKIRDGK